MKPFQEETLGQLLMVRMEENRWSARLERFLRILQPGGVLLAEALPRSAEATRELLRKIAECIAPAPFLAIREEGGTQDPLHAWLPELPSPRAVAEKGPAAVECLAELIGEVMSLLGFNTDFAPLFDLTTPLTEKALGSRTFSSDPRQVSECGGAFLRGLRRHKILACGKHFPGWGSVPLGSSSGLPVSGKPMAALWREDLLPYRELLTQLPMILVSHAVYKAYDFDVPRAASLSPPVVEGLLRVKLGYRGLALANELESQEVRGALDIGEAAIQSLNAGCDLLVAEEASAEGIGQALKSGAASGNLSAARIDEALGRVRATKKGLSLPGGKFSQAALERSVHRFGSFAKEFRPEELRIA